MLQNRIKAQAHDHPRFRAFAARYGQSIHQLNMRLSVALLRDVEAERRAKEKAEAPTVKTKEQIAQEEAHKAKDSNKSGRGPRKNAFQNIWSRKFRNLSEEKAVDLFADVVGDAFILSVATGLLLYEYWRALQKPDANAERLDELEARFAELKQREDELAEAEGKQRERFNTLEEALKGLKDPKTKKPLLESLATNPPVAPA